jgi:hypothetical protein
MSSSSKFPFPYREFKSKINQLLTPIGVRVHDVLETLGIMRELQYEVHTFNLNDDVESFPYAYFMENDGNCPLPITIKWTHEDGRESDLVMGEPDTINSMYNGELGEICIVIPNKKENKTTYLIVGNPSFGFMSYDMVKEE